MLPKKRSQNLALWNLQFASLRHSTPGRLPPGVGPLQLSCGRDLFAGNLLLFSSEMRFRLYG